MLRGLGDRWSYEDWMNDMATQDSRMPRGWQAQYQTRCDWWLFDEQRSLWRSCRPLS